MRRRESSATEKSEGLEEALPVPQDAFTRLMQASRRPVPQERAKKSDFVDEQAEESDEDNGWANGQGDDEDDDEELDGYVPDLVDDKVVEAEEQARQAELTAAKAR
jgi:hypothetical protein